MIIRVVDIYLYTKLSHDPAKALVDRLLEEHIKELSDFDLEHFVELLEETDKIDVVDEDVEEIDLEYTQDEIDKLVEAIIEEEYDVEDNDDEEEEDDYYEEDEDEEESEW